GLIIRGVMIDLAEYGCGCLHQFPGNPLPIGRCGGQPELTRQAVQVAEALGRGPDFFESRGSLVEAPACLHRPGQRMSMAGEWRPGSGVETGVTMMKPPLRMDAPASKPRYG